MPDPDMPLDEMLRRRAGPGSHPRLPVLLLGEDPGSRTHDNPRFALYPAPQGCTGYRLYCLTPCESRAEYLDRYYRRNVYVRRPDKWSPALAQARARDIVRTYVAESDVKFVVAVGARVRDALLPKGTDWLVGVGRTEEIRPRLRRYYEVAAIPHPSGRNRWYNEPGNEERVRAFFRWLHQRFGEAPP